MSNHKKVVVAGQEKSICEAEPEVRRQSLTDDAMESVSVEETHEAGTFEKDFRRTGRKSKILILTGVSRRLSKQRVSFYCFCFLFTRKLMWITRIYFTYYTRYML